MTSANAVTAVPFAGRAARRTRRVDVGPLIEPKAQSDRLACTAATASSATPRAVVRRWSDRSASGSEMQTMKTRCTVRYSCAAARVPQWRVVWVSRCRRFEASPWGPVSEYRRVRYNSFAAAAT
jgi:hypothetical protein